MSDFKKYQCRECEHIYDEAKGDPEVALLLEPVGPIYRMIGPALPHLQRA